VQELAALGAKPSEEPQQRLDLAILANPEQAFAVAIDLVNQGQVAVAALPGDLIDTD
jgi:hypothetical protein